MTRYLTADQLLDKAVAEAGPEEFGPGDFRDGLEVLLDSLERDGDLHPDTDAAVMGDLCRREQRPAEQKAMHILEIDATMDYDFYIRHFDVTVED